jgi:C1A family cysteine protease
MKAFLLALFAAAAVSALSVDSRNVEHVFKFQSWMDTFDKTYESDAAYDRAFTNFVASLARSAARNKRANGKTQYGLTKFSDLSPQEFAQQMLGSRMPKQHQHAPVAKLTTAAAPDTFDWRTKNAVSPVKDQAQCGSCWAFSATENFESMTYIKTNKMPLLSEQQLVDCDPQSSGCGGGWTYWAFQYLGSVGGQELNVTYPYHAVNQQCQFRASSIAAKINAATPFKYAIDPCKSGPCPEQDEVKMRAQLAALGPFSVCVNAQTWNDYQGGVMQGADCSGDAGGIDHCVQVVGYDLTQNYWMVRNSWNTNWGDNGYIYLEMGTNTCAIADVVTFATVA